MTPPSDPLDRSVADAILGIDTLWGGDVMCPSGTGRFIADSWYSDEPLPAAYTHPAAERVRKAGGVSSRTIDAAAIDAYLDAVDVPAAISSVSARGRRLGGLRGAYLEGLGGCFEVMWELVEELLGRGEPVPYERCVPAVTGKAPEPSKPEEKRRRVADLLAKAGHPSSGNDGLLSAVDAWRRERLVPGRSIPALASAFISELDALTVARVLPYLPSELRSVPRANIKFLPIENAWFSGSMNYLGRARKADGTPLYDATYEINASLSISVPEFQQLVSHEVVPGHVTTFAYLQNLHVRGEVGFEASVLTMNTRAASLYEGLANNAILIAHGVQSLDELPDEDLQIGVLLALLQDDAKNQSSYMTWKERAPQSEVAAALRRDFLVSEERADKLSGAWGRHPLLGRMYLPAYRAGTETVARLRRKHPPEKFLPVLFGCRGLVDVVTIEQALES
ncbi:MAG TPA: hypothetical protein VKH46_04360 [Thermoanaerobaculia bacterium]|nr:hypothetical protein [Thermoanaerobaculia bacterium]